ncbi:MAG: hypothetical protein PHC88_10880 [Terrimicrobiaceae bacterium]|nr:hypothetical protein [Terrimicrobiaceae bacterium]
MNAAPRAFRSELRAHNLHAAAIAILSLVAAILAWNLAYFFYVLILLGLVTSARGDFDPEIPAWIPGTAFALAGALLVWGIVDAIRHRFASPPDRPIIGWHLFGDFLLLPARLTFSIWGNFAAIRRLDDADLDRAWELLVTIHDTGQARLSALTLVEPDSARLHRLLGTLQLLGYIDLHRTDRDWFYAVCSPRAPELRALTAEQGA